MILLDFLKLVIGPEFTYVHVLDPRTRTELSQGFADDMINNPLFTQRYKVLSFYFQHGTLVINCQEENK